jgi:hypothetical protein
VVDLEPGADGRRRQRSTTFETKKAALRHLAAVRAAINEGRHVDRSLQTVADLVAFWLASHGKNNLRPITLKKYEHDLERYLLPSVGAQPVQKLTAARLQQVYNDLVAAGVGRRTIEQLHHLFSQILDTGMKMGLLVRGPSHRA